MDLFEKDREISGRFQPNEETKLPGYYDPHQQEILIGGTIIVVAVALLIAAFRYRIYLRRPSHSVPEDSYKGSVVLERG